jgi:superfamily II DNA or RNA helicase
MDLIEYLYQNDYKLIGDFKHDEIELSNLYYNQSTLVVVDNSIICETPFEYKRFCQKQNEWMKKYAKVYRFLEDDLEMAKLFLLDNDTDYNNSKTMNRETLAIDPSPLEHIFEKCFEEAYGSKNYSRLVREKSIFDKKGKQVYIDYSLEKDDGNWIAIEENGVSYHHPFIIKINKYRNILLKQNSVINQKGIVYRWDTESLSNQERIIDEMKEFFGEIQQYNNQQFYSEKRSFQLYEHQQDYLSELKKSRENDIKAALVVLPVGTGKTTIAKEDFISFAAEKSNSLFLVVVPSRDLVKQWKRVLNETNLNVEVITYAKASIDYKLNKRGKYDYIVVDEAHHAVAPVLQKVIRYYYPKFLLGLTATDKRLDEKKLEDVFGNYESKMSMKEAIEKGILCPIRSYRLETNIDLSEVKFNGKDYVFSQLEKQIRIPSRNELIVDLVKTYFVEKLYKPGIIFCVSVAHAKEMAKLLKENGIKAESVDGKDKNRDEKIQKYMNEEIQLLCTCGLLTEGWDAPHTSLIVMARPTLSKVLYVQQLGRGTRRAKNKEALYVVDIVDCYGSYGSISNRPWSLHALFELDQYKKFGNIVEGDYSSDELVILDSIHEDIVKLQPFDVFTMEKLYGDYLSEEQLARELFISTGTVRSWIRKNQIVADVSMSLGRSKIHLFKPDRVRKIRVEKGLKEHSEKTIVEDFWEFIEKGDYTFSYKMYFILSVLDVVDETGDAVTGDIVNRYCQYYYERFKEEKIIDRENSPYNDIEYVKDKKIMKRSILQNPFEKFERKRFMYYSKELSKISFHHLIWEELYENNGIEKLRNKMWEDIEEYYSKL